MFECPEGSRVWKRPTCCIRYAAADGEMYPSMDEAIAKSWQFIFGEAIANWWNERGGAAHIKMRSLAESLPDLYEEAKAKFNVWAAGG